MVFSYFVVMLSQLTIFQVSVKYFSDTSSLVKPFEFCYFLLNYSILLVSQLFDFALSYSCFPCSFLIDFWNELFVQGSSEKMLIVTKFVIIYSDSFISWRTIMDVCQNRSSLNSHSVKYLLRVSKIESLKNIYGKIYF